VQITSALPVAKMVGSNRTVLGNGIVHVVGDANISPEQEKELRRKLLEKALETLRANEGQN
jgi:glycine reductase complex component B subunit gamma